MWLDALNGMKKESGLTLRQVSDKSGVPIGTVNKLFAGQTLDPKLETVRAIVHCFGHTLDDLLDDTPAQQKSAPSLSDEARDILSKYEAASDDIRAAVRAVLSVVKMPEVKPKLTLIEPVTPKKPTKKIHLFGARFAAGAPETAGDIEWEWLETENMAAEFAIHVNGDSMEPLLHDGSIAYGVKRLPNIGEVAAFRLDGEFLVKQFCEDNFGNVYLFSVNRARKDIRIPHDSGRDLSCVGTILCDRVELPDDLNE